jgi:hypothetical protein
MKDRNGMQFSQNWVKTLKFDVTQEYVIHACYRIIDAQWDCMTRTSPPTRETLSKKNVVTP